MRLKRELSYTNHLELLVGIIREGKTPPDRRVAFLPEQCSEIQYANPGLRFVIEHSDVRCVPDETYRALDLDTHTPISQCDVLFGIKEVPVEQLIENKIYFFFSHTIKKQVHNRKLLQEIIRKNITLVDYECLLDSQGQRTVAFGRFAGIVGAYNAFRMWMFRFHDIRLKAASECGDMEEMLDYARHHIPLVGPVKIAITGTGRVGKGAIEVLENLGIQKVSPDEYLKNSYSVPVFTVLSSRHYYSSESNLVWDENHFRQHPESYRSEFELFARETDLFIPCHYWNPKAPRLFEASDISKPDWKIKVISDVTCDLDGSVPTTLRASTIEDPFYDVSPIGFSESKAFSSDRNITVCAVDNLPCELPYDASKAFGEMLRQHVIPELVSGQFVSIEKATIAKNRKLSDRFSYLQDYVDGLGVLVNQN